MLVLILLLMKIIYDITTWSGACSSMRGLKCVIDTINTKWDLLHHFWTQSLTFLRMFHCSHTLAFQLPGIYKQHGRYLCLASNLNNSSHDTELRLLCMYVCATHLGMQFSSSGWVHSGNSHLIVCPTVVLFSRLPVFVLSAAHCWCSHVHTASIDTEL